MSMITIVGMSTGKVYAEGRSEDCFRELLEKYPTVSTARKTYPEPLTIIRRNKYYVNSTTK